MSAHTKKKNPERKPTGLNVEPPSASLRAVCSGLRLLRESRGLTQDEIGRLAKVPPASVSRYERALVLPNLETLHRILQALGVGFSELARASEEIRAAREAGREPDPVLLKGPQDLDEDRVLAYFMAQVQSGHGLDYIEHLERWASRLRHLHEFVKDYSRNYEESQDDQGDRPDGKTSEG